MTKEIEKRKHSIMSTLPILAGIAGFIILVYKIVRGNDDSWGS